MFDAESGKNESNLGNVQILWWVYLILEEWKKALQNAKFVVVQEISHNADTQNMRIYYYLQR
jgi:hypothetical protein